MTPVMERPSGWTVSAVIVCLCLTASLASRYRVLSSIRVSPPGFFGWSLRVFWSSQTSDLKVGTAAATLPGAWCYRVSAGTGRPGVSIL